MSTREAHAVAAVIANVHGCCYVCAGDAARALEQALPEHNWPALVAAAGDWSEESMRDPS